MKKTKRKDFVARILTWIHNIGRIARLIYNKRQKKAGKIIKSETIRTVKTTHDKLFWFLEYMIPAIVTGGIIMLVFWTIHELNIVNFSSQRERTWFIIIGTIIMFVLSYELIKTFVRYLIDKFIPKEGLIYVFVGQFFLISFHGKKTAIPYIYLCYFIHLL